MRILCAGLLMVAATAIAEGPQPAECLTQRMQEAALHGAMTVADLKASGVTERELVDEAMATDDDVKRALLLTAVSKIYGGHTSLSATATAMQLACHDALTASAPLPAPK